jgi:hypothetical protein
MREQVFEDCDSMKSLNGVVDGLLSELEIWDFYVIRVNLDAEKPRGEVDPIALSASTVEPA